MFLCIALAHFISRVARVATRGWDGGGGALAVVVVGYF